MQNNRADFFKNIISLKKVDGYLQICYNPDRNYTKTEGRNMNEVNKTLYIPLYGKSEISRRGIIISDKKAEEIWEKEGFELKGKSRSKWLAMFMSMRAAMFDEWTVCMLSKNPHAVVLHIGCGLDSRILRTENSTHIWFDVDFPDVINERKKYYSENEKYTMLGADASETGWISALPDAPEAVVILEGISMYLGAKKCRALFEALSQKYGKLFILADVYTVFAAKATKYKNPINDVGVTEVFGIVIAKTINLIQKQG